MTKRYGVGYKGSKSRICDKLASAIPYKGVENFYDLFAGGCAVTHKMLIESRYGRYYANDLDGKALRLFYDGIHGKYRDEKRWISREDFFALKDSDAYVSCCWSFGNNQRDYLYSQKIEPYKKACHYAIVLDDFALLKELCPEVADACEEALKGVTGTHERRIKFGPTIVRWLKAHGTPEIVANNPLYSSCHVKHDTKTRPKGTIRDLQSLESLQSLERLQSLESLEISFRDYREMEIMPNSVVFADPPYKGTDGYIANKRGESGFDHEAFYDWCERQTELVLISEYGMPKDRFTEVWSTKHIQSLCAIKTSEVCERLFVPNGQLAKYREMMGIENKDNINKPRCIELGLFPEYALAQSI